MREKNSFISSLFLALLDHGTHQKRAITCCLSAGTFTVTFALNLYYLVNKAVWYCLMSVMYSFRYLTKNVLHLSEFYVIYEICTLIPDIVTRGCCNQSYQIVMVLLIYTFVYLQLSAFKSLEVRKEFNEYSTHFRIFLARGGGTKFSKCGWGPGVCIPPNKKCLLNYRKTD